jgi:hypothetical protein
MLSQSVTLTVTSGMKRVTRKQFSCRLASHCRARSRNPLNSKVLQKLARLLLYVLYNKNNRRSTSIKTKRIGSDTTRTTRTETQLTDFFGVDSFSEV